MKITLEGIKDREQWLQKGIKLPEFDIEQVRKNTHDNPYWIHFGAGNIFRAFQANAVQNMLNRKELDRGLIVVEGFDYEIITNMYLPHYELALLATLKASGDIEKTIVGSVMESYVLDSEDEKSSDRLKEIFENDSLQMVTFTITEKGYSLRDGSGNYLKAVEVDIENGPVKAESYMGKVVALLYHRYVNGKKPIAMVSMDNCSHNGDKLKAACTEFAEGWIKNGKVEEGFLEYLLDDTKVSFPWTMIDKITPRPDKSVQEMLEADGVEDLEPIITSKNTYIAPFVNAEECEYLVIEDKFPNGREQFEKAGFIFTDRETVDKVERMKVCTCLNPLHTALAVYGCLLGFTKISDEMKDVDLKKMVETIGYVEGLPVVVDPGVLNPKEFIDAVVNERIPNPYMPDTPQRIATDTSQKLPIRFGETIKRYIESDELDVNTLECIPLVYAGWLRYLMGIDDEGNQFELSSDPMLEQLCPIMQEIKLGDSIKDYPKALQILENDKIFGVNLVQTGLSEKVINYFDELNSAKGAVRSVISKI